MDTDDSVQESRSNAEPSTSTLPEAEAYATLLVTQYLVDQKMCSEVGLTAHMHMLYLVLSSPTTAKGRWNGPTVVLNMACRRSLHDQHDQH